jgi:uncharacterized protein YlzI (FlbEa/FlbD family)
MSLVTLTLINGREIVVNPDHIVTLVERVDPEGFPDGTHINCSDGETYSVSESIESILRIIEETS